MDSGKQPTVVLERRSTFANSSGRSLNGLTSELFSTNGARRFA